ADLRRFPRAGAGRPARAGGVPRRPARRRAGPAGLGGGGRSVTIQEGTAYVPAPRDPAPAQPALQLCNVRAGYDRVEVLHGVDVTVPAASVVALLGPNGAGKSTMLRVASGRLRAWSGQVLVDGADVTRVSPERLARRGVCTIPEGRGVFPNLTVTENLRMWSFRGVGSLAEIEEVAFTRFPRLAQRRRQLA